MRNGRKPRGIPAVETVEVPLALQPIVAGDQPETQMSLESLEEPAEILVRFSTNEFDAGSEPAEPAIEEEAAAGATEATPEEPAQGRLDPSPDVPTEAAVVGQWPEIVAADPEPAEPVAADPEPVAADPEPVAADPEPVAADPEPVAVSNHEGDPEPSPDPSVATEAGPFAPPSPYDPAGSVPVEDPSLQIRLARIHLRTGSLVLARAGLESLAGRDLLDTPGMLDLAEARWRTGDLRGAGEAAAAYLDANGGEALGFVIAAEVASGLGRHAEARRHVEQAQLRMLTSLDSLFSGMPRKAMTTATGWGTTDVPGKAPAARSPEAAAPAIEPAVVPTVEGGASEPSAEPAATPPAVEPAAGAEPETAPAQASSEVADTATTALPLPEAATQPVVDSSRVRADTEIAAGIAMLRAGDATLAALHFGIALRMVSESAPAVLDAIGDRRVLELELVRGDALRMLGQESHAGEAYQSVASALREARTAAETPVGPAAEPVEIPAETQARPPRALPEDAAVEVPAEPAASVPTDAPQQSEDPEHRPPEATPPIRWSD